MMNEPSNILEGAASIGEEELAACQKDIAQSVHHALSTDQCDQDQKRGRVSPRKNAERTLSAKQKHLLHALTEDDLDILYASWVGFKARNDVKRACAPEAERIKYDDFPTIPFEEFVFRAVCEKQRDSLHEYWK